jgi:hypothetical protein
MTDKQQFLDAIVNLSKYHREHEKFYAQAPLEQSIQLQKASGILKTLAHQWEMVEPDKPKNGSPFMGCDDLNIPSTIQHTGVLFMEGEEEPPEIARLKRDLKALAGDFQQTGQWLEKAMQASWKAAKQLVKIPQLASVLGERHRIIINDWQAAQQSTLVAYLILRALVLLGPVDFAPASIRADMKGPKHYSSYLLAASELLDRAADIASTSAILVHDNDKRWRVFRNKILEITPSLSNK